MAFFPCVRFEVQILLEFRGDARQQQKWSLREKLEYDLKLHSELEDLYSLLTKMTIIAIDKGFKLVIENPYSTQHHLTMYWAAKPALIDKNRRDRGDYQIKPTQYWFINHTPKNNLIFEPLEYAEYRTHNGAKSRDGISKTVMRSMIHPQYANRFIREFILDEEITRTTTSGADNSEPATQ